MRNGGITLVLNVAVGLMLCVVASQSRANADEAAAGKFNVLHEKENSGTRLTGLLHNEDCTDLAQTDQR